MRRKQPGPTDSGGIPWRGRELKPSPFTGDSGHADPQLAAVQNKWQLGTAPLTSLVAALADKRVLIPVMAEAENLVVDSQTHLVADKDSATGVVCVAAPDGRTALPIFSSIPAVMRWDRRARPIPVESERAALAAVNEDWPLLVLDPGDTQPAIIPRPAVWALAQGKADTWVPAPQDSELAAEVRRVLTKISAVEELELTAGKRAETAVTLRLRPGLDREQLDRVLARVQQLLAQNEMFAQRVDGLELRVI